MFCTKIKLCGETPRSPQKIHSCFVVVSFATEHRPKPGGQASPLFVAIQTVEPHREIATPTDRSLRDSAVTTCTSRFSKIPVQKLGRTWRKQRRGESQRRGTATLNTFYATNDGERQKTSASIADRVGDQPSVSPWRVYWEVGSSHPRWFGYFRQQLDMYLG